MNNRSRWIVPFMLLLSSFALVGKAQTTLETQVKSALTDHYKKYPQEKIFIHTSQPVYTTRQTIWYKLYAMAYGKPSALSKIVYVQLVNGSGRIIIQNKLPLNKGMAYGNIDLPDSLKTGWYQLKGFTAWMMNFDDSACYHQNVYIQNTADSVQQALAKSTSKYHVNFYPEGGDMVAGNPCNVAFKANDNAGLPVNIEGDVLNDSKKIVAKLKIQHNGMGFFNLEPTAGITYTAIVHFPDSTVQRVVLPAVKKEGITLQANAVSANEVQLNVMYAGPADKYENVLLTAFQNNGKVVTYPLQLGRGINPFSIQKRGFSTGLLRLTIFDSNGIPAAERVVFIDNHDQLSLNLKADTLSAQPYSKQAFNLALKGDETVSSSFSVSVSDADAGVNNSAENICSYMLLSSELRGYIHDPAWYFTNNNDTLHQQLDLVMLTNGWRHFNWSRILDKEAMSLRYPVEKTQFIAGRIVDYINPVTEKDQFTIKLLILNQDSSKFIGYVTPDSSGSFLLNDYNHSGTSKLFMEASDRKNHVKKLKIDLYSSLGDSLKSVQYLPNDFKSNMPPVSGYLLSAALAQKLADFQTRGINMKTIIVKDKKISPTEQLIKDHVTPLYTSIHEYTLDLVNNPTVNMNLVDYIKGKFPGLMISDGGIFTYLGNNTLQSSSALPKTSKTSTGAPGGAPVVTAEPATPYFFLNEAPITILDVADITLSDVALIRFMPPPIVFAPYNGGNMGAILIYTKKNTDEIGNFVSREEFNQYTFNGYTIAREFSSPDYSLNANKPADNRITLYWNDDLVPDSTGHVKFHFYNSSKAKKYRVIIQGMDANGRLGVLDEIF